MTGMPGRSPHGPLPPLSSEEAILAERLSVHVRRLAGRIGERNIWRPAALEEAARFLEGAFGDIGLPVTTQEYRVEGHTVRSIIAERPGYGTNDQVVVIGAHYDTVPGSPGANDNASGIAALIEIARLLGDSRFTNTVRFIAFVNEEPPFFQTDRMGSYRYARRARQQGEGISAMVSLETIGYYRDEAGSQRFPTPLLAPFYPSRGDFIAFIGKISSHHLLRRSLTGFRRHSAFPARRLAAPAWVPGIDWSDHWSFWQQGYPAVMITDTAPYRYPFYHSAADTPDKLDYPRMARVVSGLAGMVAELAGPLPEKASTQGR